MNKANKTVKTINIKDLLFLDLLITYPMNITKDANIPELPMAVIDANTSNKTGSSEIGLLLI
tara:strand:- start:107 stop:292 length:186 start_codon:yes stop_codon:yes gene_type:complete